MNSTTALALSTPPRKVGAESSSSYTVTGEGRHHLLLAEGAHAGRALRPPAHTSPAARGPGPNACSPPGAVRIAAEGGSHLSTKQTSNPGMTRAAGRAAAFLRGPQERRQSWGACWAWAALLQLHTKHSLQ